LILQGCRLQTIGIIISFIVSLSSFNFGLSSNSILSVGEINYPHIIAYIKTLDINKKALIHDTLMDLRGLFTFLYENKSISTILAIFIPKDNYQKLAKLPSYYTDQEIQKLLISVDQGTIVGKRDYAILILAAYLGLRASDIARIQFKNLNWEQNKIELNQYKTGKEIALPLLPLVGNALLDYIQHGRPISSEYYIFLFGTSPFLPIQLKFMQELILNTRLKLFKNTYRNIAADEIPVWEGDNELMKMLRELSK
jgi:integrase